MPRPSAPRLKALLDAAHRREFDTLLIWALDRLSREGIGPMVRTMEQLPVAGVRVLSHQEPLARHRRAVARRLCVGGAAGAGADRRARPGRNHPGPGSGRPTRPAQAGGGRVSGPRAAPRGELALRSPAHSESLALPFGGVPKSRSGIEVHPFPQVLEDVSRAPHREGSFDMISSVGPARQSRRNHRDRLRARKVAPRPRGGSRVTEVE